MVTFLLIFFIILPHFKVLVDVRKCRKTGIKIAPNHNFLTTAPLEKSEIMHYDKYKFTGGAV
jgi:hypothetical protein